MNIPIYKKNISFYIKREVFFYTKNIWYIYSESYKDSLYIRDMFFHMGNI